MDYEQKYKEILEWARKNKARLNGVPIEEVLPELRESEDERIRKEILECIETLVKQPGANPRLCDWIAWLEKQKDSVSNAKYIEDVANAFEDGRKKGEQKEQKPADLKNIFEYGVGEYFFDGIKAHYISCPAMEVNNWPADKDNLIQKPAEWSEEDKEMLDWAIECCHKTFGEHPRKAELWLKSLRKKDDLPKWKPNDRGIYEKHPVIRGNSLAYKDKFILISDLEKLPTEE